MNGIIFFISAFVLAPFMPGIINRVKAIVAGRKGQPLLQAYFDILKLLRKGAVYSRSTSWIFKAAPVVSISAISLALLFLPMGTIRPLIFFQGDIIVFAYLFAIVRFMTVLAALDTASSFEGMGASREVWIAAIAEPSLFLVLATLARITHDLSLCGILTGTSSSAWIASTPALCLIVISLFVILLAENSRIPFDDPNTHLELTMIHEVMVLDYSGPDLAFVLYTSSLKLFALSALIVNIIVPFETFSAPWSFLVSISGIFAIAMIIGLIESLIARLRMISIPQLLAGAGALAFVAFLITLR